MLTANEIRQKYLSFFKNRGHAIVPSTSLVPENDSTTLFTSSGMQPMVPYLLGKTHPLGNRIVDSQKCFRSQDIEEVGDNRHTTFFEMLGNWSLGDYFKKEQIDYIFTFLTDKTEGLGIDPKKLYATFFNGDDTQKVLTNNDKYPYLKPDVETISLLKNKFEEYGITAKEHERIFPYPATKNWWSRSGPPQNMPPGEPGGPDSEIFYDFGPELQLHENSPWKDKPCHPNCDCGRYLEIGNNVFMEYFMQEDRSLKELPSKNIDFGGGLSRLEAVLRNDPDVFNISLFSPLIKKLENLTNKSYQTQELKPSFRIIADHLQASVFLIKDGVLPSNKEQGYLLRRLIRRALIKFYYLIENKIDLTKLIELTDEVIAVYGEVYFDKDNDIEIIKKVLLDEISKFSKSIEKGLSEIDKYFKKYDSNTDFLQNLPSNESASHVAFDLHQNFGLPKDAFIEALKNKYGFMYTVDNGLNEVSEKFEELRKKHSESSRTLSAGKFKSGLADNSALITRYHTATHLLHAALRQVLGPEVTQAGSNNTQERLRFDYTTSTKPTPEQLKQVVEIVNQQISAKLPVSVETMSLEDAKKQGAMALFSARYPSSVTVYTIGDKSSYFSKEICTGPHVQNTQEIGFFEIFKEESLSSNVRRIYARLA